MMKQIKRKIGTIGLGIVLSGLLVCGCSNQVLAQAYQTCSSAKDFETQTKVVAFGDNKGSDYEMVYSDIVDVDTKDVSVNVFLNPNDYADGMIRIDGQDITINSKLAQDVGYAHANASAYDFTGDEKEEIVLIISGGASGSFQAVQVFGCTEGKWTEITIPQEVYKQIPNFVKQQQKKIGIKMDSSLNYYRTISYKNQKLLFTYQILSESGTKIIGKICKELVYSSDKNEFVLGGTQVTVTDKKCSVKTSGNKKSITIKWNTKAETTSIKGVQIKLATKKSMKNAKTYKFGKKTARKMSYKFTIKSGKVSKGKTYYFKVRLKVGNKWTKWSDVKKAKA